MAIHLKRQLTEDEKAIIFERFGRHCYANGHVIPEGEEVQYDHIRAYSLGGESELNNIAPMCAQHNKQKGVLSLEDFRIKLQLGDFFQRGDKLTLRDLLEYLREIRSIYSFGERISLQEVSSTHVHLEALNKKYECPLYVCPKTNWKYFYGMLDINIIDSDDDEDHSSGLQPRYLIQDKVFSMFRHFQQHTVLQPSIGRIINSSSIRIFDGQHKIAAMLWEGRRSFECKIYIDADIRRLNQTNIAAHDSFAQTRFYSSIMVLKLGSQFGKDFENYKNSDIDQIKSENGFMQYLLQSDSTLTRGDINNRFRSYLYSSILEHEENKTKSLISSSNRRTDDAPITMDMIQKSLFSSLLYRDPVSDNMATEQYRRDDEILNMVKIMNIFYELAFHAWNGRLPYNDSNRRKLTRILGSKSMMAWSEIFRDALCAKLELQDAEERERPLYRTITEQQFSLLRTMVERLVSWSRWNSPSPDEIDRILAANKSEVKRWFRDHGLTTGYLLGASE